MQGRWPFVGMPSRRRNLVRPPAAPQLEKTPGEFDGVAYDQTSWTVQRGQMGSVVIVAEFRGYAVGQNAAEWLRRARTVGTYLNSLHFLRQ